VTDSSAAGSPDDISESEERIAWEVPETAAVAVLAAVALLIVGGLGAGIVASTASYGGFTPSGIVLGTAITLGAQWAGPLIAFVLLAVMGMCWWQSEAWADASEPDDEHGRIVEVAGHVRRANQIGRWTLAALVLTCIGAIAVLVGTVVQTTGAGGNANTLNWSRYVIQGASLLAVVVIAGAGAWLARQINHGQTSSD